MTSRQFEEALRRLLNVHNVDNQLHTPDFMLAEELVEFLLTRKRFTRARDKWMGFENHLTREGPVHLDEGKDT